jgi:CIC family chloride channel protein
LVGQVGIGALLIFALGKGLATSFTLGAGGSGGVFAPTLFMGAGLGGAMGGAFVFLFPDAFLLPPTGVIGSFALVGMAALFAGAGRAPITCIIMLMEMTLDYTMILPLMIAVSAAYLVSSLMEEQSIYTLKLYRRGIHIRRGLHVGALKAVKVSDIMTPRPTVLSPSMTTEEVFAIIDQTHHTKFPVIDENGNVVGILIAEDLFKKPRGEGITYRVIDLMNPEFLHLAPSCTMDSALREMIRRDEGHAVIVDPAQPAQMMGYITKADVLRAYEASIIRLQKQGIDIEDIEPADTVDVEYDNGEPT